IKIHESRDMVCHPQIAGSGHELYILRPQVCMCGKSECLYPACGIFEYIVEIFVIHICDAKSALLKQHCLTPFVILEIFVLVRSDMISAQIRKNTDLKRNPRCPVEHQSLGGHFHYNTVASRLKHPGKILMNSK